MHTRMCRFFVVPLRHEKNVATMNLYGGGERCYLGTEKGATSAADRQATAPCDPACISEKAKFCL